MGELPPLRAAVEQNGSTDFTSLWSGQAAAQMSSNERKHIQWKDYR